MLVGVSLGDETSGARVMIFGERPRKKHSNGGTIWNYASRIDSPERLIQRRELTRAEAKNGAGDGQHIVCGWGTRPGGWR